jgi:hypothetical protein
MATTELRLYVPSVDYPVPLLEAMILPGSAIVGTPNREGLVKIDYEGNKFGGSYFELYAHRVRHAAGRHVANYPTVARAWVPVETLHQVGWYDVDSERIRIEDSEKLEGWIGSYTDADLVAL